MYIIMVDEENNAETFWQWLSSNATPAKFARIFSELDKSGKVTVDSDLALQFVDFVSSIPGWSDGPAYAKEALIIHEAA